MFDQQLRLDETVTSFDGHFEFFGLRSRRGRWDDAADKVVEAVEELCGDVTFRRVPAVDAGAVSVRASPPDEWPMT